METRCTPGWEARCRKAKSTSCHCACHGQNHGAKAIPEMPKGGDVLFDLPNGGKVYSLTLGDMVYIKGPAPMGGERAYVYDVYPDFDDRGQLGVSLVTESGRDTGGWSREEQRKFLEYLGRAGWDYNFKNVIQLGIDFQNGVFDKVFKPKYKLAAFCPDPNCDGNCNYQSHSIKKNSGRKKVWSRKGRCPSCNVSTGSKHGKNCSFKYEI